MDADKKKQLKNNYENMAVVGAVYAIECSENQRRIIRSTTNISGIKNRFQFAMVNYTHENGHPYFSKTVLRPRKKDSTDSKNPKGWTVEKRGSLW